MVLLCNKSNIPHLFSRLVFSDLTYLNWILTHPVIDISTYMFPCKCETCYTVFPGESWYRVSHSGSNSGLSQDMSYCFWRLYSESVQIHTVSCSHMFFLSIYQVQLVPHSDTVDWFTSTKFETNLWLPLSLMREMVLATWSFVKFEFLSARPSLFILKHTLCTPWQRKDWKGSK